VLGVGKPLGEVAVVGQQQQAGGIPVKSPHRINTFFYFTAQDIEYGFASPFVFCGSNDILGFVDEDIDFPLFGFDGLSFQADLIALMYFHAGFLHQGTIDGNLAFFYEFCGLSPGANATMRNVLIEAHWPGFLQGICFGFFGAAWTEAGGFVARSFVARGFFLARRYRPAGVIHSRLQFKMEYPHHHSFWRIW